MSSRSDPKKLIEEKEATTLVPTIEITLSLLAEFKSKTETEMYANYLIS